MSMETDIRAKNNEARLNNIHNNTDSRKDGGLEDFILNLEERVSFLESGNGHRAKKVAAVALLDNNPDLGGQNERIEELLSVTKAQAEVVADLNTELATQKAYIKGLEGKSNPVSLRAPSKGRGRGMSKKGK